MERAKAAGVPLKLWNPLQKGQTVEFEGRTFTPDMVIGPERRGIKVVYSTDTRPVPQIAEQADHADLFIAEAIYGDNEDIRKAKSYRHMTMPESAELARRAQVTRSDISTRRGRFSRTRLRQRTGGTCRSRLTMSETRRLA